MLNSLTYVGLDFLPGQSTFNQIAHEVGVLAGIQVIVVVKNDNLTTSLDAITHNGEHVNEMHVNLPTVLKI